MWKLLIIKLGEPLLALIIGVYLYRNPETKTLGEMVLVFGGMLLVHRSFFFADISLLVKERIDEAQSKILALHAPLEKVQQVIDLSERSNVQSLRVLQGEYLGLTEERLARERQRIIDDAVSSLKSLSNSRRTPILEEPDFYDWLYSEFDQAQAGSKIQIVSMDEDLEWNDTPQEMEYFRKNVAAAKRGVSVERVFVFTDERLVQAANNKFIFAHRTGNDAKLTGRRVNKEEFARKAPTAMHDAGQGFIIFDDRLAIVDVFSADGKARGYVTLSETDLRLYRETFKRFKSLSAPLAFPA